MDSTFVSSLGEYFNDGSWFSVLFIISGAILAGLIISLIVFLIIKNVSKISRRKSLWVIMQNFKTSGTLMIILIMLLFVTPLINITIRFDAIYRHLLTILFVIVIAYLLIQIVKVTRILLLHRYDLEAQDNLRARQIYTQFRILQQVIAAIIIIVSLAIILMTFDKVKQIGVSILASAGLAGLIIGFAAQKSIANVIAGIQIAITQPIKLDDVVVLEGEWGRIEEITLTYVVVRIWDQRRLILPIQYFIDTPFQNWTKTTSEILGTVFLYLDYRFPVDELRKELTKILESTDKWDQKVNVVQVTNTNERTMEVRALMSAIDSGTAWDLRVMVREKLIEFIQKNYPQHLPQSRVLLKEDKDLTSSGTKEQTEA